ncbi:MAG: hypothetical protein IJ996_04160 [Clostridia bacterium]|nr:hypothetical protein [Clostridia bacterium]
MASVTVRGTTFSFFPQKKPLLWEGNFLNMKISVENEFIHYENVKNRCSFEEVEWLCISLHRLIAGGCRTARYFRIEGAHMSVAIDPGIKNAENCSRELLRAADYTVTISMVMYSQNAEKLMDGGYTLVLNREDIIAFASGLRADLAEYENSLSKRHGKYLFVGVSPQGYKGCMYWYFDPTNKTKPNTFVWVRMGNHKTLQLVYVDSVRRYNDYNTPCDVNGPKRVLKQATAEDVLQAKEIWKE